MGKKQKGRKEHAPSVDTNATVNRSEAIEKDSSLVDSQAIVQAQDSGNEAVNGEEKTVGKESPKKSKKWFRSFFNKKKEKTTIIVVEDRKEPIEGKQGQAFVEKKGKAKTQKEPPARKPAQDEDVEKNSLAEVQKAAPSRKKEVKHSKELDKAKPSAQTSVHSEPVKSKQEATPAQDDDVEKNSLAEVQEAAPSQKKEVRSEVIEQVESVKPKQESMPKDEFPDNKLVFPQAIIQSKDRTISDYNTIKNYLLRCVDMRNVVFKECELFLVGNEILFMISLDGKLRLSSAVRRMDSAIKGVKEADDARLPFHYYIDIDNSKDISFALRLILATAAQFKIEIGSERPPVDYVDRWRKFGLMSYELPSKTNL